MSNVYEHFSGESRYPDLDAVGAAQRLAEAVRCRTVNDVDRISTDFGEFERLQELMRRSYPHVMNAGSFERIGQYAVLITIPGADRTLRPALYMSHQDVVPVVRGTEEDWSHGAFSGDIAEGREFEFELGKKMEAMNADE